MRNSLGGRLIASLALTFALNAMAQDYPNRPIRMIVPLAQGGSADILARVVGNDLAERLGKPVLVENRTGGGGHIGSEFVAKAAADGYTLLSAGIPQAIGMSLYKNLSYDMGRDLIAITQGATFPSVIVVHPSLPVKTMKELIALAKARPGKLNYGANTGSPNHLAIELLNVGSNVKMVHIPYKGAGPVVTDVMAGHIELASLGLPPALPMVQAGRLRAIAVTGDKRSAQLPDVPTVIESGIPGYNVTSWYGFFAPARTPAAIINRLNTEIVGVLKMPEVNRKLAALGADVTPTGVDEFGKFVRDEIQKWAKVVKASGATAE
ncbi:MAG: tripartite tricarboxylate transporter substrate binding protein [Burkholderiales bacterium]|nr:tripartite tricarboxylate transporter substrate binding protein [Burkholderiales bacterium]